MFYRNLTLYRFDPDTAADLARLVDVLPDHRLRPCGALEMFTKGFVPPLGRGEEAPLTHAVGACTVFAVGGEDKLLPPTVINDELYFRVQKIADEEGRKVGGRERKRIKEDLFTEFLPRAFVRNSRMGGYVDTAHGWLVLDTASRKAADTALTELREALGSFPAIPLAPNESPRGLMTDWLANGTLPANFALGDECELRDPATTTGAIARCRRQDMDAEEVREHLRNGKQVYQLGLVFDDRLSFVLGEDLVIRKLKFLDVVLDQLGDDLQEAADQFSSSLTLMTLELDRLFTQLAAIFGLAIDAPLHLHRQDAPVSMRTVQQELGELARTGGLTMTLEAHGSLATFEVADPDAGLFEQAAEIVRSSGKVSISAIQRDLCIGYKLASRLIEKLEQEGVVSAPGTDGLRTIHKEPA